MKGHMFNIDNGYLEGLCRGFKNGILRQADYLNLVQCETLDGEFNLNINQDKRKLKIICILVVSNLNPGQNWMVPMWLSGFELTTIGLQGKNYLVT